MDCIFISQLINCTFYTKAYCWINHILYAPPSWTMSIVLHIPSLAYRSKKVLDMEFGLNNHITHKRRRVCVTHSQSKYLQSLVYNLVNVIWYLQRYSLTSINAYITYLCIYVNLRSRVIACLAYERPRGLNTIHGNKKRRGGFH